MGDYRNGRDLQRPRRRDGGRDLGAVAGPAGGHHPGPLTGYRPGMAMKLAGSAAAVTAATLLVWALEPFTPTLSLGVLYVFAVLPVAIAWGLRWSLPVAVASMLAFNWFFLPPVHTFTLAESTNWFALLAYSATAVVVSELAARNRRRAADAEQRERESSLLAEIATHLLGGRPLETELGWVGEQSAEVLGISRAEVELGAAEAPRGRCADPARGRRSDGRHALRAAGFGPEPRRPAALPAGARGPARGGLRPQPARAGGARGRGAAPQRPREDGAAPRRLARPALAADRDHDRDRRAAQRDARLQRRGPPRAARHDRRRRRTARPARRRPARSLAARGRRRRAGRRGLGARRSRPRGGARAAGQRSGRDRRARARS